MDAYLYEIKVTADSLNAINAPSTDQELLPYTLFSLDGTYETLVTAATCFGGHFTFDELWSKLISNE